MRPCQVKAKGCEIWRHQKWNLCDWQWLCAKLPKLAEHHADDNAPLVLAASHLEDDGLCVAMVCPRLLSAEATQFGGVRSFLSPGIRSCPGLLWKQLTNKMHLRLSVDGVYRVTNENYALLCLGFLHKQADDKVREKGQWSTTFTEAVIAVVNSEKKQVALRLLEAWEEAMRLCCGVQEARRRVMQFHTDQHRGLMSAVEEFSPHAVRCLDFAHLVGAVRRSRVPQTQDGPAGLRRIWLLWVRCGGAGRVDQCVEDWHLEGVCEGPERQVPD